MKQKWASGLLTNVPCEVYQLLLASTVGGTRLVSKFLRLIKINNYSNCYFSVRVIAKLMYRDQISGVCLREGVRCLVSQFLKLSGNLSQLWNVVAVLGPDWLLNLSVKCFFHSCNPWQPNSPTDDARRAKSVEDFKRTTNGLTTGKLYLFIYKLYL